MKEQITATERDADADTWQHLDGCAMAWVLVAMLVTVVEFRRRA